MAGRAVGRPVEGAKGILDPPRLFLFLEVRRDMESRVASQESSPRDLPGRPNDQWLQAIFGQAAVGIAVIDGEGHFLHCNQKLAQITGRGVSELIGLKCSQVTHPDDWPASQAMMEDLRRGIRTEFSAEKRYLRPDDAVVWVNVAISPLRDATGRYDRLIAVVEDITARKRAEQAVQERELTILLIALESPSTALIAREYRIRVGPITPTAPVP